MSSSSSQPDLSSIVNTTNVALKVQFTTERISEYDRILDGARKMKTHIKEWYCGFCETIEEFLVRYPISADVKTNYSPIHLGHYLV